MRGVIKGNIGAIADPAAGRFARAAQNDAPRVSLPVLDTDPDNPGHGELWLRRSPPGGLFDFALRTQLDGETYEAGLIPIE